MAFSNTSTTRLDHAHRARPERGERSYRSERTSRDERPFGDRQPFRAGPGRPGPRRPRQGSWDRPVRRPEPSPLELAMRAAEQLPEPAELAFSALGVRGRLLTALERDGKTEAFAIQARLLPDALAGRDVLGRAQTGSGKTLAFVLPVLARLEEGADGRSAPRSGHPRALIIVPTRELAAQVRSVILPLAKALRMRVGTIVGGLPIGRQMDDLQRGLDVVVATPGRLLDLMDRGACSLDDVRIAVLDEADHLADLGFLPAVRQILDATPAGGQRLLLSATLDRGVDRLVQDYLREPAVHAVPAPAQADSAMEHLAFTLGSEHKVAITAEIASRPGRTLIFVRTKLGAERLAEQLAASGVPAAAIHGNRNQAQRQRALQAFSDGSPRVLVATDVAARGIHVDDVDLVVHHDLPNDHKDYLHRSGRTARAGASGTVLSLLSPRQTRELHRLLGMAEVKATVQPVTPGHEAVRRIAESGEPVVVTVRSRPERDPRSRRSGGRGRPGGAGRRPSS